MSLLFESLNEAQKKAAFFVDGFSLILAGAGSGKTRVLIAKVVYLIKEKKVSPSWLYWDFSFFWSFGFATFLERGEYRKKLFNL